MDRHIRQWSASRRGEWLGSLTYQSSYTQADWLWLASPPEMEEIAICALLPKAREHLLPARRLAVSYPTGRAVKAFEATGYYPHQTLIWMCKKIS